MQRLYRELPRLLPAVTIGAVMIITVALLLFVSRDINHSPHAVGSVSPAVVEVGDPVIFDASNSTDPDGDTLLFLWTIHGSITSNLSYFDFIFPQPGNYTINLVVTDPAGLTDHETFLIDVSPG